MSEEKTSGTNVWLEERREGEKYRSTNRLNTFQISA